jgi:hypothetical protein
MIFLFSLVLIYLFFKALRYNVEDKVLIKEELYGCPPDYRPYIINKTVYNSDL